MTTSAEVLRSARALYAASPSHVGPNDYPERRTHCPVTAISRAEMDCYWSRTGGGVWNQNLLLLKQAAGLTKDEDAASWNAEHSTEEVLAAFDRAIAQAEDA